jgi:hypothetical protein
MVKQGSFRVVICIGSYAIKLPRITRLFKGIRCNSWESEVWKVWRVKFKWKHLCPVLASSPLSIIVIMRRADLTATSSEVRGAVDEEYDYDTNLNIEFKPGNWGKIDGKLVCFDYGLDEASDISKERKYLKSRVVE